MCVFNINERKGKKCRYKTPQFFWTIFRPAFDETRSWTKQNDSKNELTYVILLRPWSNFIKNWSKRVVEKSIAISLVPAAARSVFHFTLKPFYTSNFFKKINFN